MVTSLAALHYPLANPKNVLDQSQGGQRCAPLMILGYRELRFPQIRGLMSMGLPLCAVNQPAQRTAYYQSVSKVLPGLRREPPPPSYPLSEGGRGNATLGRQMDYAVACGEPRGGCGLTIPRARL
jgi:hypothetical protein